MASPRESLAVAVVLAVLTIGLLHESLLGGKVLSPADFLFVSASFREFGGPADEPQNRLLTDPVLQFQPWLEFNRRMLRQGRLPLWNDLAGCGAPHLASGQSAVFDPFNLIAYVGSLPGSLSWMACARLWFAGFGMFQLASRLGMGPWGRWFAGLTFPFCGFLIVWLLYPVANVAIWLPWLLWATLRCLDGPTPRSVGLLALLTGLAILGGHIQTAAHVLLLVGLFALAWDRPWKAKAAWAGGIVLGLAMAAIQIVPLGLYLARSPVWEDRTAEQPSAWEVGRPRILDAACTGLPYLYGSQRRGQPNLARALGVHNVNESAGGFAGLATLLWLAPLAVTSAGGNRTVRFLAAIGGFGALAAFEIPPAPNVLRLFPVLDVTDHRRMTLWLAFALILLGAVGLDRLPEVMKAGWGRRWSATWVVAAAGLVILAAAIPLAEPAIRRSATQHYQRAAQETPGADPSAYRIRAERQVGQVVRFVPAYLGIAALQLMLLAALAWGLRHGRIRPTTARLGLLSIILVDLYRFGLGLNPAIDAWKDRPVPAVLEYLGREVGASGRVIGLGEELPPNVLMRYGLADARNYDSVELSRAWTWFERLYEPDRVARTSRRLITWDGAIRARERLEEAGVSAVVAAIPPPEGRFDRADRVGSVWVARLQARPLVDPGETVEINDWKFDNGSIRIGFTSEQTSWIVIRQIFDPGWTAVLDRLPIEVSPERGTFLRVEVPAGTHELTLEYRPVEVRVAIALSLSAVSAIVFTLTGFRPGRSTRIVGSEAWTDPARTVKIGTVTSTGTSHRTSTEARGADGPLHV